MTELFEITFKDKDGALPSGFWSAVDTWITKPHVVNKRLCGAKQDESRDVGADEVVQTVSRLTNCDIQDDVVSFLDTDLHEPDQRWSVGCRTIIPKVNPYGTDVQKDIIVKDFYRQRVTFLPVIEKDEKHILQNSNIYQFQLQPLSNDDWLLSLHALRPEDWEADGVAYPKLPWMSRELLPKLVRWATESRSSDFKSTLSLISVEKYSVLYQQLKDKYKEIVKVWPEVTDPEKFVFEDVAIATYLLVLWEEERTKHGLIAKQSFVDLGCGNGLLVHILNNEGHRGKGIDVRRRKIWDMYGPQTHLEEAAITPSDDFLFPHTDWLIGNHSDELTPWIPVISARSSYFCRYFVLPCCFFDFFGKYQRRQCKKSQYKEYIDFISVVSTECGFNTEEDCLRIPSTKRVCLIGQSRSYPATAEQTAEERRAGYINSRQYNSSVQSSSDGPHLENKDPGRQEDTEIQSSWGDCFHPRERIETVRNCATLPREMVDAVVLHVANTLLGLTKEEVWTEHERVRDTWNTGGSLSLKEVAELLDQTTLLTFKNECGGLQTLLKNNHQVFRVEGGRVYIRDWRVQVRRRAIRADAKQKPLLMGARKTRPCWFYAHHPQGCPLLTEMCAFAHGPSDLRPSTPPHKKLQN
ncbi:putative tRNA (uracil-O(2)-)-methyltransferase [Denticeps clupeoides]|uniref:tRNA (uracil-O(2)-)-methyltransferase n=1 Tax=Denticeps clupeoides TaxID=299321 RepID=A0AAY4A3W5_9TELE|nr:probable tRNA (uracil-O(2)-)-methyltransferase [Denticeps clupeoides]